MGKELPNQTHSDSSTQDGDEHPTNIPMIAPEKQTTHLQVFFYVQQMIDYLRYFLVIRAIYFSMDANSWKLFIFYYYVAIAMDVIDGACARLLD